MSNGGGYAGADAPNQAMRAAAKSYDEEGSEEDDDDDEIDDDEFFKQQAAAAKGRQRASISAERWEKSADWTAPVHPKTPAQREQIRAACTRSFMFAALPSDLLEVVLDAFQGPHEVDAGAEVIKQGDTVSSGEPGLYIIESGTLDVFKAAAGGEHPGKKVFQYDQSGQSFGELALLYSCPRAATVTASSKSVMWSIDRDTFNNCVKGAVQEMHTRREKFLTSVEILADLTEGERGRVADVLQPSFFKQGETIITQGDIGSVFYILEDGSCHADVTGVGKVKQYNAGDYFGELALIKKQPRAASIIADSDAKLSSLDGESFNRLLGAQVTSKMADRAKAYGPAGGGK